MVMHAHTCTLCYIIIVYTHNTASADNGCKTNDVLCVAKLVPKQYKQYDIRIMHMHIHYHVQSRVGLVAN